MPTVLLIRHAQASFGTADYDVLSERGHAQIEALHGSLERRGIVADRVVSGLLRRQLDTARPWSHDAGGTASVDERWNELDNDDVLSHHSAVPTRLERRPGDTGPAFSSRDFQVVFDRALQEWVDAGPASPARQTWPDFLATANSALDDLGAALHSGETGMAFTSSGVIAALAASLIGLPERAFVPLNRVSVNASITKVIVGSRGKTLVSYNDHGHLEDAGNDDLVTYR
jgi:broad specificity phosphatase PhoE